MIGADLVKELRRRTGIGIGKCKHALEEAKGDIETAIANLRKAGMASAVKKAGREANEGVIVSAEANGVVAVAEVNSETDFVVKNTAFQEFAQQVVAEAAKSQVDSAEALLALPTSGNPAQTVDQLRAEMVQTLGENIQIRRVQLFKGGAESSIGVYSHMGGKILCVVELTGAGGQEDFARDIAMHIAAEAPDYLRSEDISADARAKEEDIARTQVKDKPANIIDKIVEGKLRAWYDQVCLLHQKFVKDPSKTIGKLVEEHGKTIGKPLEVKSFLRWQVGQ